HAALREQRDRRAGRGRARGAPELHGHAHAAGSRLPDVHGAAHRPAAAGRRQLQDLAAQDPRGPDGDHGDQPERSVLNPVETGEYVAVVSVDDLRPGFMTTHVVEGRDIVIAMTEEGPSVFDGYCSHAEFKLG